MVRRIPTNKTGSMKCELTGKVEDKEPGPGDEIEHRSGLSGFTLITGPFNVKEHVLITIFASSSAGNPYVIHLVSAVKILIYGKTLTFWVALIVVVMTQGITRKKARPKGGLTCNEFFLIVFICNFAYYVLPGYLFPMVTSFSWGGGDDGRRTCSSHQPSPHLFSQFLPSH
ncbi:hypothetical protein E3N88_16550 [Mikania micrantha]|uniref:Uncharacterized protein n=1 Tax=Mikania micrantha TaxID=192012 RepID=A0A5N6NYM1_9ASTR|nr:hypothetical protein E3N88_16550 [Mikania micrantha]